MSGRVQGWVQKQEEIKQAFQKDVEKLDMEEKEAIQDLDNSLNTFPEAEAKEAAALEEELEENLKEITKEEEKALARVNVRQQQEQRTHRDGLSSFSLCVYTCLPACFETQTLIENGRQAKWPTSSESQRDRPNTSVSSTNIPKKRTKSRGAFATKRQLQTRSSSLKRRSSKTSTRRKSHLQRPN